MSETHQWRRCSACKSSIDYGSDYWACNVSTCNRKRTALAFCSVSCWEVHLPIANHREAWALERTAPPTAEEATKAPRSRARSETRSSTGEILIVASRLKEYVRNRSGFNTPDGVLEPLSEIVRRVCERAIRNAERDGRRTVLDRDIPAS